MWTVAEQKEQIPEVTHAWLVVSPSCLYKVMCKTIRQVVWPRFITIWSRAFTQPPSQFMVAPAGNLLLRERTRRAEVGAGQCSSPPFHWFVWQDERKLIDGGGGVHTLKGVYLSCQQCHWFYGFIQMNIRKLCKIWLRNVSCNFLFIFAQIKKKHSGSIVLRSYICLDIA